MDMQEKWYRRRSFTTGVCIAFVTVAVSTYALASRNADAGQRPAIVATGTLEGDEIAVSAKIRARVAQVHAAEGNEVASGAVLLTLDLSELEAQRQETVASLHDAEARLALVQAGARGEDIERIRAEAAEAAYNLDRFENGSRPEEVLQAEGTLRAAQAAHDQAAREHARVMTLFASGDVARTRVELAETEFEAAKGRLDSARQQVALAKAGARAEDRGAAREKLRQRQAAYDLVRAGARPEEITAARWGVERIRASLKLLDVQLADARITAPADGTVTHIFAKPGEVVSPAQPLATLVTRNSQWVDVFIEETVVGSMEIGQPAEVILQAFPGRSFSGRVSSINETMVGEKQMKDSMNVRSVRVRVQVERGDRYMRPGMSVEVRIFTGATT